MKKDTKDKPTKNSEAVKKERVTTTKKIEPGEANSFFPQEYEEQRSLEIRMKPQPFIKPKKTG